MTSSQIVIVNFFEADRAIRADAGGNERQTPTRDDAKRQRIVLANERASATAVSPAMAATP
jgi:hypothetical protein